MTEEIWRGIENYEGLYQVSNLGRVKSLERYVPRIKNGREFMLNIHEKILKYKNNGRGYATVGLQYNNKSKYFLVHRLVAQAFIPNPNNLPEVNHIDEDKRNNRVDNLEWCDRLYNINYGTHNKKVQDTKNRLGILGAEIPVSQYTLGGEYITTYKSSHEAAKQNNIKFQGNIINCCKGRCSYAYGYIWRYA